MAMAMTAFGDTVNPGDLNDWMKKKSLDEGGFDGDLVNWDATSKHSNKARNSPGINVDTCFVVSSFDPFLQQCQLIIAKVFNPESVKNKSKEIQERAERKGNHWVLVVRKMGSDYSILDPGRGLTGLSEYGRVYRYIQLAKN